MVTSAICIVNVSCHAHNKMFYWVTSKFCWLPLFPNEREPSHF